MRAELERIYEHTHLIDYMYKDIGSSKTRWGLKLDEQSSIPSTSGNNSAV
jgi:hypothetical protein